jgi:hypothetical protein
MNGSERAIYGVAKMELYEFPQVSSADQATKCPELG